MIDEKTLKKVEGVPNACCTDPENITLEHTTNPRVIIRHCQVCNCNHYFMLADPIFLGAKLAKP
jgi:hypothetical protein